MARSVIGLPSSPRPPGKSRPASSANQSLHVLTAGPSGTRTDPKHRFIHSIPSEARRSTTLPHGRPLAHRSAASERLRTSSQWVPKHNTPFSTNSPYPERRQTSQTRVNTSPPSSENYWSHAGEVTSAAIAQWRAGIPSLGDLVDESVEDDDHLLKVMRAYHLGKARTREELPGWLFDEKERGMVVPFHSRVPAKFEVKGTSRRPPREDKRDQLDPSLPYNFSDGSQRRWKNLLSRRWNQRGVESF